MKQEMDEWLKQKLDEDLEALLDERERILMESEEFQGIEMPMEKLQDIYRAYEIEKRKKMKKKKRIYSMATAAAVVMLCVGLGRSSIGKKEFTPEVIQREHGNDVTTKINNTDVIEREFDEEEVCQEIEEKLGVIPVRFGYQPKGMYLSDYVIDESDKEARTEYEYNGNKIYVYISKEYDEAAINVESDGKKMDELIIESSGMNIEIYEYKDSENHNYYITSFEYLNTYYFIGGMIKQEDFRKLMENVLLKNS